MSDHSNSVKLGEIIQEFGLEILHPGANYASIPLTTLDVNRPGLPLTGFLRMFCNEFMHSYPVYLLKRILATYFRYRRASFFFFSQSASAHDTANSSHFRNLLCTRFRHTDTLLSLPLLFLLQLLLLLPLLFQSRRP